jgi:hypothetical protein
MIFELVSINDLGRLICAFERTPQPIFAFKDSNKWNLIIQFQIDEKRIDYFYAQSDEIGSFLGYKNSYGNEIVEFFSIIQNASYIYAPIIFLKKSPLKLNRRDDVRLKNIPFIELEDLGSLIRIVTYKILYEESPLPIFLCSKDSTSILFTMLSYSEEGPARIFYIKLEEFPQKNFIKYTSDRKDLYYTNNVDESGSIYVKIIKLRSFPSNAGIWTSIKG